MTKTPCLPTSCVRTQPNRPNGLFRSSSGSRSGRSRFDSQPLLGYSQSIREERLGLDKQAVESQHRSDYAELERAEVTNNDEDERRIGLRFYPI
jgi:hypothetical protein